MKELQMNLEFQSVTDSGYQWILGAFYETNDHEYQTYYDFTGQLATSLTVVDNRWWAQDNIRDDKQKAVFGEVTVPVSDKTDLTVGFRNYETKNVSLLKMVILDIMKMLQLDGLEEQISISLMTRVSHLNSILRTDQMIIY